MSKYIVAQAGHQCPKCKTIAADDTDLFCICGEELKADAPIVGVDADGVVVEIDGKPVSAVPQVSPAPAVATPPLSVPASTASGVTTPTVVAGAVSSSKKCWVTICVDESERDGRPPVGDADYDPPPAFASTDYNLAAHIVGFGRMAVASDDILIEGDNAVSRMQGRFRLTADGGYEVENLSKSGTYIRRGQILLEGDDRARLRDGDEIEIGYWFTITYHESDAAASSTTTVV